jgi:hypothetical protein
MENPASPEAGSTDKGLKKGAIGFMDGLAIGLDSTAPAYSLAAVIGSIVLALGVQARGVLWWIFGNRGFFKRPGFEAVPREIADGTATAVELPPLWTVRRQRAGTHYPARRGRLRRHRAAADRGRVLRARGKRPRVLAGVHPRLDDHPPEGWR